MAFDPELHRQRSIRLRGYDYTQAGSYVITICTQDRQNLFGEAMNEAVQPNPAGQIVQEAWRSLPERFPEILLDACVVMPNHLHGIVMLSGDPQACRADKSAGDCRRGQLLHPRGTATGTIGRLAQAFKSVTTHHYIRDVKCHAWPPFPGRLWQRNYYERIIRNAGELDRTREYIVTNPARWAMDHENLARHIP